MIGGTPSTEERSYYGGQNLWVKIGDMTRAVSTYIADTDEKITDTGVENSNVKLIREGTVLLSFKLSIGKVAIAGRDLYTNEAIAALIPKDDRVLPKYLYYIIPQLELSGGRKAAKGKTSSKGRLAEVLIPVPSRKVQEALIRELDEREARIRQHREEIERLTADAKAVIERHVPL